MLMESLHLSPELRARLEGLPYTADETGMSGSVVLTFDKMVLKSGPAGEQDAAVTMLRWLQGRLPAPEILHHEVYEGHSNLLMTRIPGRMSCDAYCLDRADETVALLAEGLRMLWRVDIADCPRDAGLDAELAAARERVRLGKADPDDLPEGFASPDALLDWLEVNRPPCDPVFSHGDYCMPNVFLDQGRVSGMIDLGDAGVADRWRDIALMWGSLERNFGGAYGGKVYRDFSPMLLAEKLEIPFDQEKLTYYLRLNALF